MCIKKIISSAGIIVFFMTYWMICNMQSTAYIQTDISQIYDQHGITAGYFSLRSFLALYIVPLLLYNTSVIEQEKDYIAIRYNKREKIWYMKLFNLFICNFMFTCFYFFVDIIFMLVSYHAELIISSHILIYLAIYFPVVFLFFSLIGIVFMILQIYFSNWKALVVVFLLCIVCYFFIELEVLRGWNPFFFLILLSEQIQGMAKVDVILSYANIFFINIITVVVGLKSYNHKEFFRYEE